MKKRPGRNFLDMVPSLSGHIRLVRKDGVITISFDRAGRIDRLLLLMFNRPKTVNVQLDAVGTKVVELIDGKRTVHEICGALKGCFEKGLEDHLRRTTLFISMLYKNRFVELK